MSRSLTLVVFVLAAVLEVGGDAIIRRGMRTGGLAVIALGLVVLGSYGISVNLLKADFSRVLGAYVGVFAVTSVLGGKIFFSEQVPTTTWIGLVVVLIGSLIIHFGNGA